MAAADVPEENAIEDYTENGVTVSIEQQHDKPTKCKTFLNPKMVICREFVLACLKAYSDEQEAGFTKCLDAFGATGIGGIQWKHHLGSRVEVMINDMAAHSVESIRKNLTKNGLVVEEPRFPPGYTVHNTLPPKDPTEKGVELLASDANVLMHLRQFNFIHVDPYGTTVNFLDAAFRNIYNKGVMVITSTDVSAIYGKCPQVTVRNYSAYTQKTDYYKETAARVVLAAIARAAARCNKGLEVLYTVAVEHFIQVAVRIRRGAQHADETLTHIRGVLHCQMCEEYGILPGTRVATDNVYDCLPCTCRKTTPGKTAIELGPMWCGSLFSTLFVQQAKQAAKDLKLSDRFQALLHGMWVESRCPLEDEPETKCCHHLKNCVTCKSADPKVDDSPCDKDKKTESVEVKRDNGISVECITEGKIENDDNNKTEDKTETDTTEKSENNEAMVKCEDGVCLKRKPTEVSQGEPPKKKLKRESRIPDDKMPFFYYDIHRRKIKGYDIPKANKFVCLLHEEGYRASRTTFDPTAVRTNATLSEVKDVIFRRCSETPRSEPR